jgi:hypothetical protein
MEDASKGSPGVVLRLVMQVQYAHEDHQHTHVYDGSDHRQQLATHSDD